jgi:hypothetical protein
MARSNFLSDRGHHPITELAQLIRQADPHEEATPTDKGWREKTVSDGYDEPPRLPLVPQLPEDLNAPEQAYELDKHCHDEKAYHAGYQPCAPDDKYQNENPYRRRRSSRALR